MREVPRAWYKFLTTLCAIIGGVFTVAGILDSILYNGGQGALVVCGGWGTLSGNGGIGRPRPGRAHGRRRPPFPTPAFPAPRAFAVTKYTKKLDLGKQG